MTTEYTWKDLSAIHKAGALSRYLLQAWESSHANKKEDESANVLGGAASLERREKIDRGFRLVLLASWVVSLLVTTTWKVELAPLLLVSLLTVTGLLMFPSPLHYTERGEAEITRKFAKDLSQLCELFGKTPAALAQMDEQALKNLATRFLRSAARELAKLDPKSQWSTQNEAHDKMRKDFRELFDFFKSFGLTERSGWYSYFPDGNLQEALHGSTGDRDQVV